MIFAIGKVINEKAVITMYVKGETRWEFMMMV